MGQTQSHTPYEGPPEILESKDLPSLAKFIKSNKCKRICVMVSAPLLVFQTSDLLIQVGKIKSILEISSHA
ncbi:hypothetical protein QCA50_006716 [Cerrena zonata]|uniref:Uncharacterized protein n=1 Tax=Cerrena zonata TaxID=2478898 RepID=A0AAW0GLW2_9APHY